METNDDSGRRRTGRSVHERSLDWREMVLEVTTNRPRPMALADLATSLTDRMESEQFPLEDARGEYHVELHLHHVVLPKLQAAGAIEYSPSRHLVL